MITADQKTADLEQVNDDLADKLAKKIEAKLHVVSSLGTNVGKLLEKVESIGTAVTAFPSKLKDGFDHVAGLVDSSNSALSEGIMATNETLYNFGLDDDGQRVNIPAGIHTLLSSLENSDDKAAPAAPKVCIYSSNGLLPVFVCKCGCGNELQLGQSKSNARQAVQGSLGGRDSSSSEFQSPVWIFFQ